MTRTTPRRTRPARRPHPHGRHSKAACLRILKQLSAYVDGDLGVDICAEIRKHLGACPNCEVFIASLRRTIDLCRHAPPPPFPASLKARVRRDIRRAMATQARTAR